MYVGLYSNALRGDSNGSYGSYDSGVNASSVSGMRAINDSMMTCCIYISGGLPSSWGDLSSLGYMELNDNALSGQSCQ